MDLSYNITVIDSGRGFIISHGNIANSFNPLFLQCHLIAINFHSYFVIKSFYRRYFQFNILNHPFGSAAQFETGIKSDDVFDAHFSA